MLQTILEEEGFIIETAKKGIESSEKAFFILTLIDVRFPDVESIERLSKLRDTK